MDKRIIEAMMNNTNVLILEEEIDVNIQMVYYRYSSLLRRQGKTNTSTVDEMDLLYREDIDDKQKKKILAKAAGIDNAEIYKKIEDYVEHSDGEMHDWALLARYESQMLLQGSLLNEQQFFISTGLGGKGDKLRYFCAFTTKSGDAFDPTQKKIMRNEMKYALEDANGELESMRFDKEICMVVLLLKLNMDFLPPDVLKSFIKESNTYGNFISEYFLINNVKRHTASEIRRMKTQVENDTQPPADLGF
ncbi:MAG: hypothetical protein ACK5IQ_04740 [Bacteroidales bacterium]